MNYIAPNPRLQRTPSAPLSRQPLGVRKQQLGAAALVSGLIAMVGCALALPEYNKPFDEKIQVISDSPAAVQIRVGESELQPVQVPGDGRTIVHIPTLPRECSTFYSRGEDHGPQCRGTEAH